MSKDLATYEQIRRAGRHVIGLPFNSFRLAEENSNWFVYAAPMDLWGNKQKFVTLFWVNHDTEEAVEYCSGFDRIIDPTCYPYGMHANRETGQRLVDARFAKLAALDQ